MHRIGVHLYSGQLTPSLPYETCGTLRLLCSKSVSSLPCLAAHRTLIARSLSPREEQSKAADRHATQNFLRQKGVLPESTGSALWEPPRATDPGTTGMILLVWCGVVGSRVQK